VSRCRGVRGRRRTSDPGRDERKRGAGRLQATRARAHANRSRGRGGGVGDIPGARGQYPGRATLR